MQLTYYLHYESNQKLRKQGDYMKLIQPRLVITIIPWLCWDFDAGPTGWIGPALISSKGKLGVEELRA